MNKNKLLKDTTILYPAKINKLNYPTFKKMIYDFDINDIIKIFDFIIEIKNLFCEADKRIKKINKNNNKINKINLLTNYDIIQLDLIELILKLYLDKLKNNDIDTFTELHNLLKRIIDNYKCESKEKNNSIISCNKKNCEENNITILTPDINKYNYIILIEMFKNMSKDNIKILLKFLNFIKTKFCDANINNNITYKYKLSQFDTYRLNLITDIYNICNGITVTNLKKQDKMIEAFRNAFILYITNYNCFLQTNSKYYKCALKVFNILCNGGLGYLSCYAAPSVNYFLK